MSRAVWNLTFRNWALPVLFSSLIKYICSFAKCSLGTYGQLLLISLPYLPRRLGRLVFIFFFFLIPPEYSLLNYYFNVHFKPKVGTGLYTYQEKVGGVPRRVLPVATTQNPQYASRSAPGSGWSLRRGPEGCLCVSSWQRGWYWLGLASGIPGA